ncbi:MAG: pentapeptide repeat-containing protein [Desulfotalea sp.]
MGTKDKFNLKEMQARWNDVEAGTSQTKRDAMLSYIIENCQPGNLKRPQGLDLRGIDFRQADLSALDLSGYDFSGALLNLANLAKSNLSYCKLCGAHLEHSNLDNCEFFGADLEESFLSECSANHCGFGGASMVNASVVNAKLNHAVFSMSNLEGADFRASDLTYARLTEANLQKTVYTRANLNHADLKHSDVKKACFGMASLRNSRLLGVKNFREADWVGADLRDMDLRGAYRIKRYIADENYLFEYQQQSKMHKYIYKIWWITSDCGRSLGRWLVWLVLLNLIFAWLYTIVGVDYGDHETWYSPIYFSLVTLTTLGYGDAVPSSLAGQLVVSFQALIGYMGLGGLLSILGNKMSRRAE